MLRLIAAMVVFALSGFVQAGNLDAFLLPSPHPVCGTKGIRMMCVPPQQLGGAPGFCDPQPISNICKHLMVGGGVRDPSSLSQEQTLLVGVIQRLVSTGQIDFRGPPLTEFASDTCKRFIPRDPSTPPLDTADARACRMEIARNVQRNFRTNPHVMKLNALHWYFDRADLADGTTRAKLARVQLLLDTNPDQVTLDLVLKVLEIDPTRTADDWPRPVPIPLDSRFNDRKGSFSLRAASVFALDGDVRGRYGIGDSRLHLIVDQGVLRRRSGGPGPATLEIHGIALGLCRADAKGQWTHAGGMPVPLWERLSASDVVILDNIVATVSLTGSSDLPSDHWICMSIQVKDPAAKPTPIPWHSVGFIPMHSTDAVNKGCKTCF